MMLRDLEQADRPARERDAHARRVVNALTVSSSIISALIHTAESSRDESAAIAGAREMFRAADDATTQVLQDLELHDAPDAAYRVMRVMSQAVSERWRATAAQGRPSADLRPFLGAFRAVASQHLAASPPDEISPDDVVARQIAIMEAMAPVLVEVEVFDFFADVQESIKHARAEVLSQSVAAMQAACPDHVGERSTKLLFHALMRHAGHFYASAWRREAERLVEHLRALPATEQRTILAANPKGFSLQPVDVEFRAYFGRLVDTAMFLAVPPAGSDPIENEGEMDGQEHPPLWEDDGELGPPLDVVPPRERERDRKD